MGSSQLFEDFAPRADIPNEAFQVAGPLFLGGIVVSYYSNSHGQGRSRDHIERQPGRTTISAMSTHQSPSVALVWGKSPGIAESAWEIYCKKPL